MFRNSMESSRFEVLLYEFADCRFADLLKMDSNVVVFLAVFHDFLELQIAASNVFCNKTSLPAIRFSYVSTPISLRKTSYYKIY